MILKVTLLFALALLAMFVLRRAAAATRHALLAAAQVAALALPLLVAVVPALPVPHTEEVLSVGGDSLLLPRASHPTAPRAANAGPATWSMLWVLGAIAVITVKLMGLGHAIGVVRRARNGVSEEIDQPMTFGSHVLLPASSDAWSDARLNAVLLHERAHVQRHDTLLSLIGDVACAVYWFHPLAWLIARRARLERERACDDAVLRAGIAADEYASAIVDIARGTRIVATAMPMAAPSQLETRIAAILDPRVPRRASGVAVAALAMVVIAPALAALEADIARPRLGEPDLRNDSPPQSELLPDVVAPRVEVTGRDAEVIAMLLEAASRGPRHEIDYVPERSRWALSRVRNGRLVEPLLESLEDRDWRVRVYAAWALGYAGDTRATAPLIAMLSEPAWRERAAAANALANLADPAAEEAMLRVVDDPAWQVRSQVAQYLGARGTQRATLHALRKDRHMYIRVLAEEALR